MKHFSTSRFRRLLFVLLLSGPAALAQGPTVVGSALSPARNAIAAPRTTSVQVPFSQAINPATAGNIKVFSSQYRGQRTAAASTSGSTVTLAPTAPAGQSAAFKPGETVVVSVPATVASAANAATPYVYQFTAAASGGSGRFLPGTDPSVGTNPQCVVLGDVDGDGDLDLLTANNNASGTVSVRLNNGSGVFGGGSEVAVGSYPGNVVLGDVDGDGDLDLATANSGSFPTYGNTVSIRLNDGAGNFMVPATNPNPAVGANPKSAALGDIDGDGDLDLLTANYDSRNGTVSVRFNNGTGNFTAPATNAEVPTYYGTTGITLGDIDNDGDLDFVTANSTAISVSFRYNDGRGSFTPASNGGEASAGTANSVALGDIDGDGDLDCITSNASPSPSPTMASLVYNNNGGFFGIAFGIEVGAPQPSAVVLGDVDGDGDLDLLSANSGNNTAGVRLNNGHSSFSASPNTATVSVGANPSSIAVGDVDGDGDLDLVTANAGNFPTYGNTVSVRLNALAGNVASTLPSRNALAAPRSTGPSLTFVQSLNPATVGGIRLHRQQGTGQYTASASGSTVTLAAPTSGRTTFWPGEAVQITVPATVCSASGTAPAPYVYDFTAAATGGTGVFVPGSTVSVGIQPTQVVTGDIDNDGDLDLLTAAYSVNTGSVIVHRNNGLGAFAAPATVSIAGLTQCLTLADIDNDGDLDLLAGRRNGGYGGVSIRFNNGNGVFSGTQEIDTGEIVTTLAIGDIDGDGDLDFILPSNSFISRCFNDGNGVFTVTSGIGNIASPQVSLELIDVDGDGDLDLVAAYRYASNSVPNATVAVWLNDGKGEFWNAMTARVGSMLTGMVTGDVDGDGDVDLLLSDYGSAVYLLLNNGQGTFTSGASALPNVPSGELALGDIDGDGDMDILSNAGGLGLTRQVSVRVNDGNGNFSGNTSVSIGTGPLGTGLLGTALADVDNDGDLDMLTPDNGNNNVNVRLNNGGSLAVANTASLAACTLFPNPASSTGRVSVTGPVPADVREVSATVLNALGQTIATGTIPVQAGQASGILPIVGLAPGIYTVRLQAGTMTFTNRLIVL